MDTENLYDMQGAEKDKQKETMAAICDIILSHFSLLDPFRHTIEPEDKLQAYCLNICHWGLHLMELDDTAREGDLTRTVPNLKVCIPFFYSHSVLSKYFVECIHYILQCEYQLSPMDRIRVLEGSYVNLRGGKGSNVEADLVQEHHIRYQKDLIKGLGANKTELAIKRATGTYLFFFRILDKWLEQLEINANVIS